MEEGWVGSRRGSVEVASLADQRLAGPFLVEGRRRLRVVGLQYLSIVSWEKQ